MKRLIGTALLLSSFLFLFACLKGDPAEFPAKDIRDLEAFNYAPANVAVIVAVDFDLLLRDPVLGPKVQEMMRETGDRPNMFANALPFYDQIKYIHGVAMYSRSSNAFGEIGSDLSNTVALLSVEMDEQAVRAYVKKNLKPLQYRGYTAFALDNNMGGLFLGNGRLLVGGDQEGFRAMVERAPETQELLHHLFPDTGTLLYMYIRNDKKADAKGATVADKINYLEINVSIDHDEIIMATACDVELTDAASFEELKREILSSTPLATVFKDAAPLFVEEPWGLRVILKDAKSSLWENMKTGFTTP